MLHSKFATRIGILRPVFRFSKIGQQQKKRFEEIHKLTPDDIAIKPDMDPSSLEYFEHPYNYNLEENKKYTTGVAAAKVQRNILSELRANPIPRRQDRIVYDKPKYDTDISNYDCWQEYGDMIFTKEYPHEFPVLCKILVAPKVMLHVFGDSINNSRNGIYSTKEWDFIDSNMDKFLVYDFKSSTSYWGENRPDYWYAVLFELIS